MTPAFNSPDYRNLGTQLRIFMVAQFLALAATVVVEQDLVGMLILFTHYAAHIEAPLFMVLLVLYFLSARLTEIGGRVALLAPMLLSMACGVGWEGLMHRGFPEAFSAGLMRAMLISAGYAAGILIWLDWRTRRLSPALVEARLQALQARIRPHFLFNSLNSVLSLIRIAPSRAEEALENLADLYRVLMADNRELSSLAREMELARAYQELEALRLGARLKVTWRTSNAPLDARLPALLLQPLLENAVYHGVEAHTEGGEVGIDIFAKAGHLYVVVRNPLRSDAPQRRGNRMALSNIRERLALHFDAEARLSTHQAGGEFVVQVVLPLVTWHTVLGERHGEENTQGHPGRR